MTPPRAPGCSWRRPECSSSRCKYAPAAALYERAARLLAAAGDERGASARSARLGVLPLQPRAVGREPGRDEAVPVAGPVTPGEGGGPGGGGERPGQPLPLGRGGRGLGTGSGSRARRGQRGARTQRIHAASAAGCSSRWATTVWPGSGRRKSAGRATGEVAVPGHRSQRGGFRGGAHRRLRDRRTPGRRVSGSRALAGLRLPGDTGAAEPVGSWLRGDGTTSRGPTHPGGPGAG